MKSTNLLVLLALLATTDFFTQTTSIVVEAKAKGGGGSGGSTEDDDTIELRSGRNREVKFTSGAFMRFLCIFTLPVIVLLGVIMKNLNLIPNRDKKEPEN